MTVRLAPAGAGVRWVADREPAAAHEVRHLAAVVTAFAAGAVAGTAVTAAVGTGAIAGAAAGLLLVLVAEVGPRWTRRQAGLSRRRSPAARPAPRPRASAAACGRRSRCRP